MSNPYKIGDAVAVLEKHFPLHIQDSWDNSGLIIGCKEWTMTGILLTVDITEERVDEAIDKGCNLIVSHHPILFRPLQHLNYSNDEERLIAKAIKNDIAICAFHTPADKSSDGLSYQIGKKLELSNIKTMVADDSNAEIGYGIVGTLKEVMSSGKFVNHIKSTLGCECIRHNECDINISKVAVCTGSGSEFIKDAMTAQADAYVTADIKYHQFQQPEGRLLIADIGHYESEEISKKLFFELLTENFSNFAICISSTCRNVIKYN